MRYAERLVQVEMADVGTDVAWAAQTHLRIHVGAIHVYLAAVLVDDAADLFDRPLEDPVGRRVSDHQRGQGVPVRRCLRSQVLDVDVPPRVALDRHDLHPRHDRTGWVGAMGKIGRASCRERGWVSGGGGDVSEDRHQHQWYTWRMR